MEELQLRLLEKQLTTKFFLILGQKGHLSPKNGGTKKKVIALNLYIFFKNDPIENMFALSPSPKYCNANMQKKGATKKASRKTVYKTVFKVLAKKVTFIKKKCGTTKTKYKT